MAEGVRSIQAFWMGGGAAAPYAAPGGARSMQAHWMGGGAAATAAAVGGVRSLQAFWMGGACAAPGVAPPEPQPPIFIGGAGGGAGISPALRVGARRPTQSPIDDDDEDLLVIATHLARILQ